MVQRGGQAQHRRQVKVLSVCDQQIWMHHPPQLMMILAICEGLAKNWSTEMGVHFVRFERPVRR